MASKPTGNPVGRPSKVTPSVLTKLEQAFAIDCTNREACSYAQISEKVFYEHVKKNPDFSERIRELKDKPVLKARDTLYKSLDDPIHAKWLLERKKRKEYGANIDLTTDGKELPTPLLSALDVQNNNSNKKDS